MASRLNTLIILAIAMLFAASCGKGESTETNPTGPTGKDDSGWIGGDTYEVQAEVRSTVTQQLSGEWENLAEDKELQLQLVDTQIKFIKTKAESHGWRFNQLAESVEIKKVTVEEGVITIEYTAQVDMLGRLLSNGRVPSLEDLDPVLFPAKVPADPDSFSFTDISDCSESDGSHSVRSYNFHYYFAPDKEECKIQLVDAEVEITKVFARPTVYPEYDRLMQEFEDGTVGFTAALIPNRGDNDPRSRFNAHAKEIEDELELVGEDVDEGKIRRYTWQKGKIKIVIDLFDPTKLDWSENFYTNFREQLGTYTLVHYNGHSAYGTQHLLDDPEAFSDSYQIISIHSCQSYAYYTRQIFRAKVTEDDPSGFNLADVIATGKSSYPSGAPPVITTLISSLMEGMTAISEGNRDQAPDWLTISKRFDYATWGDIMYGVAGVRTNSWQP